MADVGGADRAVSPVFGYALTLGIATILISGLLISTGGFVDSQREEAAESELRVIGQQLSADIAAADRLDRSSGATNVSVQRDLPRGVLGSPYIIHVRADGAGPTDPYLELTMAEPDVSVRVGIALPDSSTLETGNVGTGAVEVRVDGSGNLEVRNV